MCVQDCNLTEHDAVQLVKDYTIEHAHGAMPKGKGNGGPICNELQVLVRKVISVCPKWKSQVNEALKTQFAHQLQDQYFAAMAHNLLKVAPSNIAFTNFQAECILIFGTRSKRAAQTTVSTNVVKNYSGKADQPVKSTNQVCKDKKREKIKAQTEMIEQQKKEIENLKAAG